MRLLIDLGNTRLKWATSGAAHWQSHAAPYRDAVMPELLNDLWGKLPAPSVVVAVSVAAEEAAEAVADWVREHWRIHVHRVRPQPAQLGIVNRYRDPAQLGADRWVALIGARAELPDEGVCVVGCGTAVTIDALTSAGKFAGGVIIPGLSLSRQALTRGTAQVRAIDGNETSCLARTTGDAVAAGSVYGIAGAIERVHREFEQALGEPMKLLVTGGDADRIASRLAPPVRRSPELLLKGLDRIAAAL